MRYAIVVLIALNAAWMTFDGMRALLIGDYVTPASGPHAGQLGPWATILRGVGIEPRSKLVKAGFVTYGLIALSIVIAFAIRLPWAGRAIWCVSIAGLWYAPIGTIVNVISIGLLILADRWP
jgi:type IV secretory pathway VirB6-like protein